MRSSLVIELRRRMSVLTTTTTIITMKLQVSTEMTETINLNHLQTGRIKGIQDCVEMVEQHLNAASVLNQTIDIQISS